ncbi:unnamed protein product [Prorocentrum cordatum]|uniref:Pantothenate kinase n=2 Tax=Prorocentrum cordatum TaxID=2364126 RepID=A0ABN9T034_9DINO|nr:unnamed protein product [Polarella glacialis]
MDCCLGALCRGRRPAAPGRGAAAEPGAPLWADRCRLLRAALACTSERALQQALDAIGQDERDAGPGSAPEAAGSDWPAGDERAEDAWMSRRRISSSQNESTWKTVLGTMKSLKKAEGRFGMDIGGTLVKCALVSTCGSGHEVPEDFGPFAQRHQGLEFDSTVDGQAVRIHFVSSETAHLDSLLSSAKTRRHAKDERLQVVAAGGGAHRFRELMRQSLNVDMVPFQEMESLVSGLRFLCKHGPDDEVFCVEDGVHVPMLWPWPLFPCLLVVMGSGVSVLRVEADRGHGRHARGGFTRVGGTACGGATFMGLSQVLTSATSFAEALALAERGDASQVNLLVSDIYGKEGCRALGLPGELTAACFGKLVSSRGSWARSEALRAATAQASEADTAAAVLAMVVPSTSRRVEGRGPARSSSEGGPRGAPRGPRSEEETPCRRRGAKRHEHKRSEAGAYFPGRRWSCLGGASGAEAPLAAY